MVLMDIKMRYVGKIHRLFETISVKEKSIDKIINEIYTIMNKDKEITKIEIEQALRSRNLI